MYSDDDAGDDGARGLLFMSYQTSIDRQFEKLTTKWMNLDDPPEGPSVGDLLVGQNNNGGGRRAVLRSDGPEPTEFTEPISTDTPWIVATGGEYLSAPAVSVLQRFAYPPPAYHPAGLVAQGIGSIGCRSQAGHFRRRPS